MNYNVNDNIYGDRTGSSVKVIHRIFAVLCFILAASIAGAYFYLEGLSRTGSSVVPAFEEALTKGDYEEALRIYRDIQDYVLSAPPESADKMEYENQELYDMEEIVSVRVDEILRKVRYERYTPSTQDQSFLGGMQELTTSIVSSWLKDLCTEFLLGKIEKPDITFVFNTISPISNFSATVRPLQAELDMIEMATGDVRNAETHFEEQDYITAVKTYQSVIERNTGFVHDYSTARLAEIKETMYEPMITLGEHMLDTYKYYTAENLLSDLAAIFPDDARIANDLLTATTNTNETAVYNGKVEVLCVRNLIADTDLARSGNFGSAVLDKYLTCTEFERMLTELYNNNFCLVDAEGLADLSNDTYLVETKLTVPVGKKPLIIVVEDLTYSASNYGQGLNRRLVLNDQGQVCSEYVNSDGEAVVSRLKESIGILDRFVEEHHDFTYDGAKGVISISGYEACFGYVISQDELDDRNSALAAAGYPNANFTPADIDANCSTVMTIAEALKDDGWKFASATYGYINARSSDMDTIKADTEKWMTQIEPLLGDTHMIAYPNGDYIYGTDPRAVYLKNNGFRIFFGIGPRPYYIYGDNYLYYDRTVINGKALKNSDLSRLFDADKVVETFSE
ncbi:hypothetical protein SAMN02910456_00909 [Ruminococcaceae bacterium YRB3002]|nr:hypothetical protein SAMN02910456_00909 [Ruminococcaceae bacterium YRB3002]